MVEIKTRTFSASGLSPPSAPFCNVRKRLSTLRFRSERLVVCRERFAADFVFAMTGVVGPHRRGQRASCQTPSGCGEPIDDRQKRSAVRGRGYRGAVVTRRDDSGKQRESCATKRRAYGRWLS